MSWYRIIIITLLVLMLEANASLPIDEDTLIMQGLCYDESHLYERSRKTYAKLFNSTQDETYLFKEVNASLYGNTHMDESLHRLLKWNMIHPNSLKVKRLLIPLYLNTNKLKLAKDETKSLLKYSHTAKDLELAANSFIYFGDYQKSLKLLKKIYMQKHEESILLRIVNIMDTYANQRKDAIKLLNTHRHMYHSTNKVFTKLLLLYAKEEDINGLLQTYKDLYKDTHNEKILLKIVNIYAYQKDIDGVISFLEKLHRGEDLLYELYKIKKYFKKAICLTEKQYKKDNDPRWLAEKAILLFESSKNKHTQETLKNMITLFDKALKLKVNDAVYLNYYGYTLVNNDIDINKGISIIQHALTSEPSNVYYLDSLAWGYYKKHECSKAYNYMKRVIENKNTNENIFLYHWYRIKSCK